MDRLTIEKKIQELYIGILGRAADAAGLKYWADEIVAGVMVLENTRAAFTQQPEYTSIYASLSSAQLVTSIYQNLLERNPDQGGLNYWVSELDSKRVNPDQFVVAVINAAQDSSTTNAQTLIDAQVLTNKVSAATYFTSKVTAIAYDTAFSTAAKSVVSSVDHTAESLVNSQQYTDTILPTLTPAIVTLSSTGTFSLNFMKGTAASETLTVTNGPGEPVVMGLEGNDTFMVTSDTGLLLGGSGDDTYHLGNKGSYVVIDSSGNDHLHIPAVFTELNAATVNNGRDLLLHNDDMGVFLPYWQSQQMETITLTDGVYNYNDLVNAVQTHTDGDFTDSYAEQWLEIPQGTLDPHINLFKYLSEINSTNYDSIIKFDTSNLVGSEPLIDYLL